MTSGSSRTRAYAFAEKFEENDVKVYWIEYPEKPMAAFGPMMNMHSGSELMIVPGGSIIPKKGYALAPTAGLGRAEYLARWAFWNLGIPPLLTVTGKGVWVASQWLADDVFAQGIGVDANWEGLAQVAPVLKRVCGETLHIQPIRTPGWRYFDKHTGANTHGAMVISALDSDKVLVHTPGIDIDTHVWLRKMGYKIVEADLEPNSVRHSVRLSAVTLELGATAFDDAPAMRTRRRDCLVVNTTAGVPRVRPPTQVSSTYNMVLGLSTDPVLRWAAPRPLGARTGRGGSCFRRGGGSASRP